MDPSPDHQEIFSDPQESSASEAQPEEPSAVSCETNSDHHSDSEPVDAPVIDTTDDDIGAPLHPPGLPSQPQTSKPAQVTEVEQPLKFGPYSDRYYPHHHSHGLSREELREIAAATLDALDDGFYYPPPTKVTDLIGVSRKEEEHDTEADEIKEEGEREGEEGDHGESKKEDKESEIQDGSDEKVHSERQDGNEEDVVNYWKVGREPYDLKTRILFMQEHTRFIAPDDETLSLWFQADLSKGDEEKKKTRIIIAEYSTLVGSRKLQEITQNSPESKGKIGILNFASAKKPGGGFLNGSQAQEESLARSSTLYASLLTPTARQFYRLYSADPDNAFYTHAMVYSPSVILFRDDDGDWTAPIGADILTSAAVNAGDVRKQVRWEEEMKALRERVRVAELARRRELSLPAFVPTHVRIYESEPQKDEGTQSGPQSLAHSERPSTSSVQVSPIIFASDPPSPPQEPLSLPPSHLVPPVSQILGATSTSQAQSPPPLYPHPPPIDPFTQAENLIAAAMHERIARVLYLFHLQGAKHLVLGSFGTGVFQNSVELIARIFRDLLCEPETDDKGKEDEDEEAEKSDLDNEEAEEEVPFLAGVDPQCRGKFRGVFDTVNFAILGGSTVRTFREVFEGADGVEFDEEPDDGGAEGLKDAVDFRAPSRKACDPPA